MLQSLPIFTSPMMAALSARKQFSPNSGVNPLTDFLIAIAMMFYAFMIGVRWLRMLVVANSFLLR